MSRPSKTILPPVGSSRRMMQRAIVDFPQPDSPTTPSVSPFRTVNVTPSTAFTEATSFWKMIPRVTGKCLIRLSTTSRSSPEPLVAISCGCVWFVAMCSGGDHAAQELTRLAILRLLVEVAALKMVGVGGDRSERRHLRLADLHHVRTARMEATAPRRIQQRGRLSLDLRQPFDVRIEARQRTE